MSDHPLKSFLQAVDTDSLESDTIERTYIRATDGSTSHIETVKRIKAQGGWSYREIPTGHQAMVTMPKQLAVMLNEIAD